MKRSGQQRPFRTIGARMRDFGRSMMRHYVPPQELPSEFHANEPPPPAWGAATQTPLVWPEPPAPASFSGEAPPDAGMMDEGFAPDTQDFGGWPGQQPTTQQRPPQPPAQPPQPRRPGNPQQPPLPPSVQRKPQAGGFQADDRLKKMLAMHEEREARRESIREAAIQRQSDPDAPKRPRRGRMSVDYVETSALSHGEEPMPPRTPPSESQPVQREADAATPPPPAENVAPPADEPPVGEDTARLDPSEIQSALDAISLQRELTGQSPTFEEEDYIPAGDEDAQAFFDSPPDWSEDSGDMGTPPPIDPPPTPMPPGGTAQRMPSPPDAGDAGNWDAGADAEAPYEGPFDDSATPPSTDVINLPPSNFQRVQRQPSEPDAYQPPAEPDFGGAADFEPSYGEADYQQDAGTPDADYFSPPSDTIQRDFQPASDVGAQHLAPSDDADANYELPMFDMDEGDTRPVNVQRAPMLPPLPDFADDMTDVPPAETGYSSLADWMDAQSESYGDVRDMPSAPDRPVSGTVQRDIESSTTPVAPDFSLQTGDYNRDDYERNAAAYIDAEDESDTRPIDVQRAFSEPEFWGRADEQPTDAADPVEDDIDYFDYSDQNTTGRDVYTPPTPDVSQPSIQREYEQPPTNAGYDQQDTQAYSDADDADVGGYFDDSGYDQPDAQSAQDNAWSGEVSPSSDAAVQRDYELPVSGQDDPADTLRFDAPPDFAENTDFGYENVPDADTDAPQTGDVYTSPVNAHGIIQRDAAAPDNSAYDAQSFAENAYVNEDVYDASDQPPASEIQWGAQGTELYAPPADVNQQSQPPIQRAYDANVPAAETGYVQDADAYDEAPVSDDQTGWSGDAYSAPDTSYGYDEQPPAPQGDGGWSGNPQDAYAPPTDTVQRDYESQPYADEDVAVYDETAYGYDAQPSEGQPGGDVDAPPTDVNQPSIQRDYDLQAAPPVDETGYAEDAQNYADDADESAPGYGYDAGQQPDQAPYDAPWTGDSSDTSSAPTDAVQRDYYPPSDVTDTDAGYDASGQQPMDLYQAMMGAGMVTPDSDAPSFDNSGWDGGVSADSIQRTPDAGEDAYSSGQQPVDLYQAMMQTGMIESEPDDPYTGSYYPPEPDTSMSAATKADLLSLLDTPAPHSSRAPETGFTPDVSQTPSPQNTVSRTYQPPPQTPPVIQRAETDSEESGQGGDVDVDQLARDVYNALRNRLRIERERRDRKP